MIDIDTFLIFLIFIFYYLKKLFTPIYIILFLTYNTIHVLRIYPPINFHFIGIFNQNIVLVKIIVF